jgi:NTP pyrophosphatase (non-canonical NTP hydrolase)
VAGKAAPVSAPRATPTNAGAKPEMKASATTAPNGARVEPAKATIATPAAVSNGTADRTVKSATASATGATSGGPAGDAGAVASTAPDVSFREFQQLIRDRYYATDSARGVPGTFMWLIEEVGELATSLQDNAPGQSPTAQERSNLVEEFADVIAWLTTLANIAKVDLAEALTKYTDLSRVKGVKN